MASADSRRSRDPEIPGQSERLTSPEIHCTSTLDGETRVAHGIFCIAIHAYCLTILYIDPFLFSGPVS